ncbi:MAG: hypothetical protein U1E83_05640 [Methylotetracoccus sp.]
MQATAIDRTLVLHLRVASATTPFGACYFAACSMSVWWFPETLDSSASREKYDGYTPKIFDCRNVEPWTNRQLLSFFLEDRLGRHDMPPSLMGTLLRLTGYPLKLWTTLYALRESSFAAPGAGPPGSGLAAGRGTRWAVELANRYGHRLFGSVRELENASPTGVSRGA